MKKKKLIPFDPAKAIAGAKVVTSDRRPVKIIEYNRKSIDGEQPIVGMVDFGRYEDIYIFKENGEGDFKLFIEEDVNTRPMTRQELSDWLRECHEEHRECKYENGCSSVYTSYAYKEAEASKSVDDVLIRRNHGEWEKPLIEIND